MGLENQNDTTRIIPISRKEDIEKAKFILDHCDPSQGLVMELTTARKKRTTQANRYYWAIVKALAKELWGEHDPSGMHEYLKAHILVPMIEREGLAIANSKSRQLLEDWLFDWDMRSESKEAHQRLYRRLSTTWLSNKGMSLYIDLVKEWAAGMNIVITEP